MKNLYLATTGLTDFYVIAKDFNEAQYYLETLLNKQKYGFAKDRKVTNIKVVARALQPDFTSKDLPNFSSGNTLLIVDEWAIE